jgi:hypothetical protein
VKSLAERARFPRFHVGETIVMTKAAVRAGLLGRAKRNRAVVLVTYRRMGIKIRRSGLRSVDFYSTSFWRHLRKGERA